MSDQTTGTTKQPGSNVCTVCGAENHTAGYHENRPEGSEGGAESQP